MKSFISRSILAAAALVLLSPLTSSAAAILGGSVVVASDGNVIAKFLGGAGASYSNDLYLDVSGVGLIFNNHTSSLGNTVDLGFFTAGTELIFRLHVNTLGGNSSHPEYDLYTGPAFRNPDGIEHAYVDDAYSATETSVAFEDIFGGGDLNYGDMVFSFTNVKGTPVPPAVPDSASTAGLLLLGLTSLYLGRRRLVA